MTKECDKLEKKINDTGAWNLIDATELDNMAYHSYLTSCTKRDIANGYNGGNYNQSYFKYQYAGNVKHYTKILNNIRNKKLKKIKNRIMDKNNQIKENV